MDPLLASRSNDITYLPNLFKIIEICDASGQIRELEWLRRAEPVHRQLRPHLPSDYLRKISDVCSRGGRVCIAISGEDVVGIAVYRILENTADGLHLYVDDLVTEETKRSLGLGKGLLSYLQSIASECKCTQIALDSGTH